jgi:hypothetical protein
VQNRLFWLLGQQQSSLILCLLLGHPRRTSFVRFKTVLTILGGSSIRQPNSCSSCPLEMSKYWTRYDSKRQKTIQDPKSEGYIQTQVAPGKIISLGKYGSFKMDELLGQPIGFTYEIVGSEKGRSKDALPGTLRHVSDKSLEEIGVYVWYSFR